MSHSQHPVALRVERLAGDGARLLATVMCLPLLDGIFPALVLAGALSGLLGIFEVGLLVFGGSATLAVILAEMDDDPRANVQAVLAVGAVVLPIAAIEAALAPTIAGLVDLVIFERFAALVILAVAATTASARVGELLPRPTAIIVIGLLASVDPAGARFVTMLDAGLIARAVAAAGVGVAFALVVAWSGSRLRDVVDIDRFRFGSAVALGVFALSLLGAIPADAPVALAVLGVTGLFAFNPESDAEVSVTDRPGTTAGTSPVVETIEPAESVDATDATAGADKTGPSTVEPADDDGYTVAELNEGRAPWL